MPRKEPIDLPEDVPIRKVAAGVSGVPPKPPRARRGDAARRRRFEKLAAELTPEVIDAELLAAVARTGRPLGADPVCARMIAKMRARLEAEIEMRKGAIEGVFRRLDRSGARAARPLDYRPR